MGRYASWKNKASRIDLLKRLPAAVKEAVARQLQNEVDALVAAQKRAAPVDPKSENPGALRDSLRAYPTPNRELSYRIIADARDEHGHVFAGHVEYGHLARDGKHVPPRPWFWPTYRARKRAMKRRLSSAASKAAKAAAAKL